MSIKERGNVNNFLHKMEEAFHCAPRVVEQVLQAALQHKNSLCFFTRLSPGVDGAGELDSMGSSKVLLENNSVISHEKMRRESS
jgi:hypothetical protein